MALLDGLRSIETEAIPFMLPPVAFVRRTGTLARRIANLTTGRSARATSEVDVDKPLVGQRHFRARLASLSDCGNFV